jgi:hypothetical protein
MVSIFVLALFACAAPSADEDVALRLAELTSPVAADRARAERWLAAHLAPGDLDAVARAASEAGAEARRRLALAVGAEDRLLALAAGLAVRPDPGPAEVGRDAVREIALAWSPDLDAVPLSGDELALALQRSVSGRGLALVRVDLAAPLADVLDLLRRSGEVPLNLIVDPRIADRTRGRAAAEDVPYVAAWSQLLPVLAGVHGLALEGVGLDADGEMPGGAFVVFRAPPPGAPRLPAARALPSGAPLGAESGLARLERWVHEVAAPADASAAPGAVPAGGAAIHQAVRRTRMEALLATGWPAAWTWIGALHDAGDTTAGEALLTGAAAGVWPAAWGAARDVDALLARLRTLQAEGFEPEAGRVARALAAAPARLADGTAVPALLGAAWDGAGAAERRQLLVTLEGVAAPGDPAQVPAWEERMRALLADAAASPALVRQALRAWCAVLVPAGAAPPEVAALRGALGVGAGWSAAERREVASLLARSGARPPEAFDALPPLTGAASANDPAGASAAVGARAIAIAWLAAVGEVERAGALAAEAAADGGAVAPLGDLFGHMARRGDAATARAVLAAARATPGGEVGPGERAEIDRKVGEYLRDERIDQIALLARLLEPERAADLGAAIASAEPAALALLGAAAGVPAEAGDAPRARLLAGRERTLATNPRPEELVDVLRAVERALADLLRAGADAAASGLRRDAAVELYDAPQGEMRDRLAGAGWPAFPPALDAVELALLRRP